MVRFIRRILFAVPLAFWCTAAVGQTVIVPVDEVHRAVDIDQPAVLAGGWPGAPGVGRCSSLCDPSTGPLLASAAEQSRNQPARRDSLWNGAIAGTAIGAILGSVVGLAISDCSECSGFNVPLTFGALGAGIGAGIGMGIDAVHGNAAASPQREPHLRLSPLFGRKARGLMAWIRF